MLGVRFSLFTRIIIWFFLNLLLLAAILFVFFSFNFRFRPNSGFSGGFSSGIETVTRQITDEATEKSRAERDAILEQYTEKYPGVEFFLFDDRGVQLGGREITLPPEVSNEIIGEGNPPPRQGMPPIDAARQNQPPPNQLPPNLPSGGMPAPPSIYLRTTNPTIYWFGARVALFDAGNPEMVRSRLLAASDSFYGHGLFFNPLPWLILTAIIVIVSILFWLPFVRNITRGIGQISKATEQIAEENFDTRVSEKRTDELGSLGASINQLATRLSGFVHGQRRFLGDISHELNSPLARMNFALTILEDRVDEKNRAYVEDVKEEVELMAKLVSELLVYSKAGIKTAVAECEIVNLKPLVELAATRETAAEKADIKISIADDLKVSGQGELLVRAFSNIVRNAIRYAGAAGEISITAEKIEPKQVKITFADHGAGVPGDALDKIFNPLYRVEVDRSRQSGGSGLGLAIVKTCVEACGGKVFAENRTPNGLAIKILLNSTD